MVRRYLKGRAKGESRKALKKKLGLSKSDSSLIDVEWNALTYAGHTVWNMRNEKIDNHYVGGKRRPRQEWIIGKNTHTALISREEAELILDRLEKSSHSQGRMTSATYLLTRILKTPAGDSWHGNGKSHYRTKGKKNRYIEANEIDSAVLNQLFSDLGSTNFIQAIVSYAKKFYAAGAVDPTLELRKQIKEKESRISRLVDLALDLKHPNPTLRKIDQIEEERNAIEEELKRVEEEHRAANIMSRIDEDYVADLLANVVDELTRENRETIKQVLRTMIDQIVLDPVSMECCIHYKIGVDGRNKVASPRGVDLIPRLYISSSLPAL